ncbi:DUF134 domain-containing protein [Labilibacter marinus]|uniref:DUF134 domain-containing protein n=1 Tax=Labilibacter marinus TaxID=1477105 RepID=UPI00094F51FB|nr:DUF134 domain-containing protein [Labilibacter marinus]
MPRTKGCRRIGGSPNTYLFKPAGIKACELQEVVLAMDEFEAIRLADEQGLYQAEAAEKMGISRQTFGRIIEQARKKVATALVNGYVLRVDKGSGKDIFVNEQTETK